VLLAGRGAVNEQSNFLAVGAAREIKLAMREL
jgi:hypothetical protein